VVGFYAGGKSLRQNSELPVVRLEGAQTGSLRKSFQLRDISAPTKGRKNREAAERLKCRLAAELMLNLVIVGSVDEIGLVRLPTVSSPRK